MTKRAYSPEVQRILDVKASNIVHGITELLAMEPHDTTDGIEEIVRRGLREAFQETLPYVLAYTEPSCRGPRG